MVKKTVRRARELELDDIMKMAEDLRKEIIEKNNKLRTELGEPLIEA